MEILLLQKMIVDLHSTEDRFSYASETLDKTHPSMMTLALRPKAKANVAKSMTVCLLSALKSHSKKFVFIKWVHKCRDVVVFICRKS